MWPGPEGLRAIGLGTPGGSRATLNAHVRHGSKRATAGLLAEYEQEGEELETPGERLALLDDDGRPLAVLRITEVHVRRFVDVPWEFAVAEGEGFTDLDDWRRVHRACWGGDVPDDAAVVCLHFDLEP